MFFNRSRGDQAHARARILRVGLINFGDIAINTLTTNGAAHDKVVATPTMITAIAILDH